MTKMRVSVGCMWRLKTVRIYIKSCKQVEFFFFFFSFIQIRCDESSYSAGKQQLVFIQI